jgi:putative FmdB family regulatory protein
MPTYEFACVSCRERLNHISSISDYVRMPPTFVHCGQKMERFFSIAAGVATSNALAGDRHYEGLRAPDGSDISSRTKHRAYMKAKGLTTVDDYTGTWKRQAQERAERLAGADPGRKHDVAAAIEKLRG